MSVVRVYPGIVLEVHDGDTLTVALDVGFNFTATWPVRLLGMNARELSEPGGREARDHLAGLCPVGSAVTVRSVVWDKYGGRIDGIVYPDADAGASVAGRMCSDGYAAPWNGVGPRPVPPWPMPAPAV